MITFLFTRYENAYITDTSIMPIQDFVIGGQFAAGARITYQIGDLQCSPRPFGKITFPRYYAILQLQKKGNFQMKYGCLNFFLIFI